MDGEAKQPRPEDAGTPQANAYEPPAIVWEEEMKAIAAESCATLDPFSCPTRPTA